MYYYNDKNNELYHYGVKGMRWGVRKHRDSASSQTRAQRKSEKRAYKQKLKADVRMNKKGMIAKTKDFDVTTGRTVKGSERYYNTMTGEEYSKEYMKKVNKKTAVSRLSKASIAIGAYVTARYLAH